MFYNFICLSATEFKLFIQIRNCLSSLNYRRNQSTTRQFLWNDGFLNNAGIETTRIQRLYLFPIFFFFSSAALLSLLRLLRLPILVLLSFSASPFCRFQFLILLLHCHELYAEFKRSSTYANLKSSNFFCINTKQEMNVRETREFLSQQEMCYSVLQRLQNKLRVAKDGFVP